MEEVWKDVVGYEGFYKVSNLGNVKSVERVVSFGKQQRTVAEKIRVQRYDKGGYLNVMLSKENKLKLAKVHRLVAEAFILNPKNYEEVNHKDENKENNCVDNLEWCSHYYNNMYGTKRDRQAKKKSIPIIQYNLNGDFLKEYISAMQAEIELKGKFTGNINKCLTGKVKTAYGYIWRYKEAE